MRRAGESGCRCAAEVSVWATKTTGRISIHCLLRGGVNRVRHVLRDIISGVAVMIVLVGGVAPMAAESATVQTATP